MKPLHEAYLWVRIPLAGRYDHDRPRHVIEEMLRLGLINHWKQAHRTLEKWANRGVYEYGVSLDLGWRTTDVFPIPGQRLHVLTEEQCTSSMCAAPCHACKKCGSMISIDRLLEECPGRDRRSPEARRVAIITELHRALSRPWSSSSGGPRDRS